ncbi:MAG: hypothetical protein GF398_16080 [Chitinivibrionales bacterium]|nr:hypothetical protein [Chitinivibrionales bacterium]
MTAQSAAIHFDTLRKSGGRITPTVRTIINILYASKQILSPQQLKDKTSDELGCAIGFPTIYRVIDRLLQAGLICPMHSTENQTSYFLCRHPRDRHHHHFICSKCKKVQEVNLCTADRFEEFVEKELNAKVTEHIMQFAGICGGCREGKEGYLC